MAYCLVLIYKNCIFCAPQPPPPPICYTVHEILPEPVHIFIEVTIFSGVARGRGNNKYNNNNNNNNNNIQYLYGAL